MKQKLYRIDFVSNTGYRLHLSKRNSMIDKHVKKDVKTFSKHEASKISKDLNKRSLKENNGKFVVVREE